MTYIKSFLMVVYVFLLGVGYRDDNDIVIKVMMVACALFCVIGFPTIFRDSSSAPVTGGSVESKPTDKPIA